MQNVLITKKQLEAAGYKHPQIFQHALALLIKITGTSAQHVLTNKNPLTPKQQEELDKLIRELTVLHKPLAYVIGDVPFGNLTIITQPPTLIPRPETEEWVHELIKFIGERRSILRQAQDERKENSLAILDLCTGSGCIALTLAKAFPAAQVIGSDISTTALKLAQKNRALNNIKNCFFVQSDLFEKITQKFDIIIANPPYVAESEWLDLAPEITNWEDKKALVADNNGLALAQQIIAQAPRFFKKAGTLVLEMGYRQADALYTFAQSCGYTDIQVKKDFEGNDRVLMGQYEVGKHTIRE